MGRGSRRGFCPGGRGEGTSEQLGPRPNMWCYLTVNTAPYPNRRRGIIGLGIPSHTGNFRVVGS